MTYHLHRDQHRPPTPAPPATAEELADYAERHARRLLAEPMPRGFFAETPADPEHPGYRP